MTKPKMVTQPVKVTSAPPQMSRQVRGRALELLPAQQRVQEIDADNHRNDQTKEIGGAHMRSIPSIRATGSRKASSPSAIAKMSMAVLLDQPPSSRREESASPYTDFVK